MRWSKRREGGEEETNKVTETLGLERRGKESDVSRDKGEGRGVTEKIFLAATAMQQLSPSVIYEAREARHSMRRRLSSSLREKLLLIVIIEISTNDVRRSRYQLSIFFGFGKRISLDRKRGESSTSKLFDPSSRGSAALESVCFDVIFVLPAFRARGNPSKRRGPGPDGIIDSL